MMLHEDVGIGSRAVWDLFGIGSTNLVKPKDSVQPRLKKLDEIAFFERMNTYIPEPLAMEGNQRPEIFRR